MSSFLGDLPEFDWQLFRLTLEGNDLPPVCEECGCDWRQYRRRVELEDCSYDEIVRVEPAYAVMTLECPHGHHHRWVNYPSGNRMPDAIAAPILAREQEREANENECR